MITNTNNVGSSPPPAPEPKRTRVSGAANPAVPTETLSTTHATQLKEALANTPAIRAEVVERAAKLSIDPAYPPLAIIEKVASLIANSNDLSNEE